MMSDWELLEEFVETGGYHGDGSKVTDLRRLSDEAFRRLGQIRSALGRRTSLAEFRSWPIEAKALATIIEDLTGWPDDDAMRAPNRGPQ